MFVIINAACDAMLKASKAIKRHDLPSRERIKMYYRLVSQAAKLKEVAIKQLIDWKPPATQS
jgi:hypothetical protein